MDKKVIIDFDETLIKVNSFPNWVLFLLIFSIRKFDFNNFSSVLRCLFLRKIFRKLSHQDFKLRLMKLNLKKSYYEEFSKKISQSINTEVYNYLQDFSKKGYKIAISSAAPEKYLKCFIKNELQLKNVLILGTTIENNVLNENFGENKIKNLINKGFLKTDEEFEVLFTDSYHDLPLAKLARKVYLINPQNKSKDIFIREFSDKLEIIK